METKTATRREVENIEGGVRMKKERGKGSEAVCAQHTDTHRFCFHISVSEPTSATVQRNKSEPKNSRHQGNII